MELEARSTSPAPHKNAPNSGNQNGVMWLGDIDRSRNHLSMTYGVDDLRFETAYWYSDVDLYELEEIYGAEFMQWLYFHILAFESTKVVSLAPKELDLGPFRRFHTEAFDYLWHEIVRKVWGQWRYENNRPQYQGPKITGSSPSDVPVGPVYVEPGDPQVLAFCGGGKDSLVAMKLLERGGVSYDSYAYAHSIYGSSDHQHKLIDGLLDHTAPEVRRRHWVYDSFADSPVMDLRPEYGQGGILLAETPVSLFGVLPVVLTHGYTGIALAHERSANVGNLIWDETGEDINHQWGKSLEAEKMLSGYVQETLVENTHYFSLLQPLYDVAIFNLLSEELEAVPDTHSCNIDKPWCMECPKCAYVWLNYMAYLPTELVDDIFGRNLFNVSKNVAYYRQMLGLEEHTPFECIGQIPESQLAFELCRHRGLEGKAMDVFRDEVLPINIEEIVDEYVQVDLDNAQMPDHVLERIAPQLARAEELSRQRIQKILN